MKYIKLLLVAIGLSGLLAAPAFAAEPGSWTFKVGAGLADPKSRNLVFDDNGTMARVDIDSASAMTLSATYMFNENWALDILASTPFKHDINMSLQGAGAGVDGVPVKIGSTKHLPPTVSIQYRFVNESMLQPYVGLGVNWTTFFDTNLVPALADEGITDLRLDDSFGLAAQVGADWTLTDRMFLNADVRWINVETDATLIGTAVDGSAAIGKLKVDPWVYAINLGFRF